MLPRNCPTPPVPGAWKHRRKKRTRKNDGTALEQKKLRTDRVALAATNVYGSGVYVGTRAGQGETKKKERVWGGLFVERRANLLLHSAQT